MQSLRLPQQALRIALRSSRYFTRPAITAPIKTPLQSRITNQTIRSLSTTSSLRAGMAAPTDTQAEEVQNSTGITPETLSETLKASTDLNASHVDIQDISGGCGASFAALIVSDAFQGKSALQRHRLVNGILKDEIKAIHAWTPKCLTTEQWEKSKAGQ